MVQGKLCAGRGRCGASGVAVILIVLFIFGAHHVHSYSDGAPSASCYDGQPSHGASAQTSKAPYQITTDVQSIDSADPSQGVTVTMIGTDPLQPFSGFLMVGKNLAVSNGIVGAFSKLKSTDRVLFKKCFKESDTVTHTNSADKSSVSVRWTPPAGYTGNVTFTGTFVKSKRVFWVNVKSPVVVINKSGGTTAKAAATQTTVKPAGANGPATTIKRKRKTTTVKKPTTKSIAGRFK